MDWMEKFINSIGKNEMDLIASRFDKFSNVELKDILVECLYLMEDYQKEYLKRNLERL